MPYLPDDVKWEVLPPARDVHNKIHAQCSAELKEQSVSGLRQLLCDYFTACGTCDAKGVGISPMGPAPNGGRAFKVRWGVPGAGRRGGLRLAVVAFCPAKHIVIAGAWVRRDEPSDQEIREACESVSEG